MTPTKQLNRKTAECFSRLLSRLQWRYDVCGAGSSSHRPLSTDILSAIVRNGFTVRTTSPQRLQPCLTWRKTRDGAGRPVSKRLSLVIADPGAWPAMRHPAVALSSWAYVRAMPRTIRTLFRDVFQFMGPPRGRRSHLRLSPALKTRKRSPGAGLPVFMRIVFWTLSLHSAVQAGPEPRITITPMITPMITPATAYVPPAPAATDGTGTTTDLLAFIRALEAPRGYIDYERRISLAPPKPLTAMTVGEVLDWQVRVRRSGAPSTAAGGYQIIYPTLKRLVSKHGIARARLFNAATQDHLARLLIGECGRKGPTRNHPRYGNCLAGIWAALPLTHGPKRGRSAYHGVAGNKALTHPDIVLDLLAGLPVTLPTYRTRQPLNPAQAAQALRRIGNSIGNRPLAFGASRITVEEINTALRKARRDNTLTPPIKTWKRDPYAQN